MLSSFDLQAAHPILRHSPDLRLFLQANETEFAIEASRSAAEAGDAAPAATSGAAGAARKTLSGAARLLSRLGQTAAGLGGGGGGGGGGGNGGGGGDEEEDTEYLRIRAYVSELEGHLEVAHRQAARLVRHHADMGAAVAEFGGAMAALGRHEEAGAGGEAGRSFAQLGDRSAAVGAVCRRSADGLAASFEAPLKELSRSVRAAKKAMADRGEALAARQAARAEADARRARLAKLRATPGMREERVAEAERDLRAATAAAEGAAAAYAAVVERMGPDLGRFQRERAQEMAIVLRDFAQAEAEASGEVARLWRSLVPALARADAQ
jgi:sorting nexin-1/2